MLITCNAVLLCIMFSLVVTDNKKNTGLLGAARQLYQNLQHYYAGTQWM